MHWVATILAGVQEEDGAIIGARSVVLRDVAPYCIVTRNPARCIKKRFTDPQIEQLLRIRWWDWPIEKIGEIADKDCVFVGPNATFTNNKHPRATGH